MKKHRGSIALLAIVAVTFLGMKSVRAELVFEDDLVAKKVEAKNISLSDSDEVDQDDLAANESTEESSDANSGSNKSVSTSDERVKLSRSEMLRRHRMRTEMKNEDKLTERLEELRLKDEMKRLDNMVGKVDAEKDSAQPAVAPSDEIKVVPVGQMAAAPVAPVTVQSAPSTSVAEVSVEKIEKPSEDKMTLGITPRVGMSGILNSNFEVNSRYSFGVGIHVDVMSHFGFELGYTRAQYNVAAGNAFGGFYNPYALGLNQQTLTMNQNVFDIGPRINILGKKSRIQPFISAGVGYYRSGINLDARTLSYARMYSPALAADYTVSGFLGYVGGGAEVKITDNIGITGMFRYYNVFSARESNPLASAAFVSQNSSTMMGYSSIGGIGGDPRASASKSFGKAHFYTIQGGVTLSL